MPKGVSSALCKVSLLCCLGNAPSHGMSGYFLQWRVRCIRLQGMWERCFLSPCLKQLCLTPIPGVTGGTRSVGGTVDRYETSAHTNRTPWAHSKAVCFHLSAAAAGGKLSLRGSPLTRPLQAAGPVQLQLLLLAGLQDLGRKACLGGSVSPPGSVGKCSINLAVQEKCRSLDKAPSLSMLRCFWLCNHNILSESW